MEKHSSDRWRNPDRSGSVIQTSRLAMLCAQQRFSIGISTHAAVQQTPTHQAGLSDVFGRVGVGLNPIAFAGPCAQVNGPQPLLQKWAVGIICVVGEREMTPHDGSEPGGLMQVGFVPSYPVKSHLRAECQFKSLRLCRWPI